MKRLITRKEAIIEAKRCIKLLPKNIRLIAIDNKYNLRIGITNGTTPLNHNRLGGLGWIISHFELTEKDIKIDSGSKRISPNSWICQQIRMV